MNDAASSSSCPSSDDDDDSSSDGGGIDQQTKRLQDRADIEPVDSDDDSSDYDSEEEEDDAQNNNVSNFDDLPTDDSEDESVSDDSDDGSIAKQREYAGEDSSDDEGNGDNDEEINPEDVPLSERVASSARVGRRYGTGEDANATSQNNSFGFDQDYSGKKKRVERKSRAIELASERLREARKEKESNRGNEDSDDSSVEQDSNDVHYDSKGEPKRKKSKHAPTEMSSKRRDYFARGRPDLNSAGIGVTIGANKYKARDPRMISLSGHLDADVFDKRYGFLDEVQEKEVEQLKRRVKAWQTSGKKGQKERRKLGMVQNEGSLEDDQEELTRLTQERAERKRANVVRAAKHTVKQKMREDVASGKRGAYYPKRSELRKMEAEAKYEEIRKRGGSEAVDKAITKRRKKNVSKAAKSMPSHMVK
eukprot:CAMPEP_0172302228 /NCGR_PEP_ID=MMETSP1058-20130122/3967_1 /TAXON_ID=83371 /ORGANISM="Detonula confervacea, Strain CCMP 353" /LENGTH=420 /DNA_ID=CAMNT_0013012633 /DNA_START=33 /DNA_END=1295 /DNA_ORIENTATION=-